MPKDRVTDVEDGSRRAEGFDMPGVRVDSDDAVAVYEAAAEAVGRARDRNGPTLMEIQVHRRMGHFMGDPQVYRPEEDQEAAAERDSIERLAADLRAHGVDDVTIQELREEAEERVGDAIRWAKDQPEPDPEAAHEDVWVNSPSGVTETEPDFEFAGGEE
jgi:TPP-dependent pyruvate/acetoin dehydrogenase alpha subunit